MVSVFADERTADEASAAADAAATAADEAVAKGDKAAAASGDEADGSCAGRLASTSRGLRVQATRSWRTVAPYVRPPRRAVRAFVCCVPRLVR